MFMTNLVFFQDTPFFSLGGLCSFFVVPSLDSIPHGGHGERDVSCMSDSLPTSITRRSASIRSLEIMMRYRCSATIIPAIELD